MSDPGDIFKHPPGTGGLRVSDADREATAKLLRDAHAEGRLDTSELEERLERCYAARTQGELDQLVADLPGAFSTRARDGGWQRRPRFAFAWFAPFLLVAIAFSVAGHGHAGFFAFPLVFFLFASFRHRGRRRPPRRPGDI
jgi:hypothetical protein